MAISSILKGQYEGVIRDLEQDRIVLRNDIADRQRRLREIDNTIITLQGKLDPNFRATQLSLDVKHPSEQRYAFISVHWAILHLLGEAKEPMSTADIAEALKNAGVRTKAANFSNNVSAVLSTNMRARDGEEVESVDGKWRLTEIGKNKITHIVRTEEFLRRCPWAGTPAVGAAGVS